MAVKPTTLARWATTGAISAPSELKKDSGWVAAERPPAEWLNWMADNYHRWQLYLNDFEADARTWTGAHEFTAAVSLPADTLMTHGDREISMPTVVTWSNAVHAHMAGSGWLEITGNGGIYIPMTGLPIGATPTAIWFNSVGDGAVDMTLEVYRVDNGGAPASIGSGTYNNVSIAAAQRGVSITTAPITRGQSVFLLVSAAGISSHLRIGNITLVYNRA